ncbi:RTA1-domain-containing protein [Rhizodiscina lignyota]|uniref:RTA1-domain-containing protein n=1 Tax=Rhizodiscina lignyota TaxID=1504668 RepID=A0A9P4MAJ6_9PEZI|nr:RTA1-domain-containing protein [Rhizodiscina lignyota]
MTQLKPVDGTDVYLWKYLPSIPAAVIFILSFTGITSAHCWRMVKTRSWFCIPVAVGGLFQVIGYGTRVFAYYHTDQIAPYAVQSSFILLAPVFYAATIYMTLGRLIRSVHGEHFSIVRPVRMTRIFVAGDILSLTVQGNAAGLTVKKKTQALGEYIVTAGLFIQLIIFGFFVVAALVFHIRIRKAIAKGSDVTTDVPWRPGLKMIYACSALIIVRSIFRVIEYMMGIDAYLLSHEWSMYIFDAVLMLAAQVIFCVWFPDKLQLRCGDRSEDGFTLVENELPTRYRP